MLKGKMHKAGFSGLTRRTAVPTIIGNPPVLDMIENILTAIAAYRNNAAQLDALLEEHPLNQFTEEEQCRCLIEAGMTKSVALFNGPALWNKLLAHGLTITPAMAQRAFAVFAREGAICSLRLILPHVPDINAPVCDDYTALAYTLNGALPTSPMYDGFWRIRMNAECAKTLLDAGADLARVKFMDHKLGMSETEMAVVLNRAFSFLNDPTTHQLTEAAGTPNDAELYTLMLLLRASRLPEHLPVEREVARKTLDSMTNWRRDLSRIAAGMLAMQELLGQARRHGGIPELIQSLKDKFPDANL